MFGKSDTVREVLTRELRTPQVLREAWRRWVLRLPPGLRSATRRLAAVGRVLLGVSAIANLVWMTYFSVTTGKPPFGVLLGAILCLGIFVGLMMLLYRWLYPNGFPKEWYDD